MTDSSAEEDETRCLRPQCGLCHQAFVDKECVIIGYKRLTSITYVSCGIDFPDGVRYLPCDGCSPDQKHFVGSHLRCFKLISGKDYVALLRINKRSFKPGSLGRRERLLQEELTSSLTDVYSLPPEIGMEIAQYLIGEYFVASLSSIGSLARPGFKYLDVSAPITLRRARFGGLPYVIHATNEEGSKDRCRPERLLLSEDEFGITDLHLVTSESAPLQHTPGLWWKTITLRENQYKIKLFHDGLKYRSLEYLGRSTVDWTLWSTPITGTMRNQPWCRSSGSNEAMRMVLFSYNMPEMTGLSVRCICGPAAWFAHTDVEDLSCYATDTSTESIWIYIPLHQERITTLWMRHPQVLPQDLAFAFETDKKRCCVVGAQGAQRHLQLPWSILDVPDSKPGSFFFDGHPGGARQLSFATAGATTRATPPLPRPWSTKPDSLSLESYWSSASLEGIKNMQQCKRMVCGILKVIGLLFEYDTGIRATVGQVRLDSLTKPQAVHPSTQMWLAFRLTEAQHPYVSQVELSESPLESPLEGPTWFQTDWVGELEWWFSQRQCQLWYKGQTSLRTRV